MDPTNNVPTEPNAGAPAPQPAVNPTPAVNADVANAALNPPVNPVVAPGAPAPNPVTPPTPAVSATPVAPPTPVTPPAPAAPAVPGVPGVQAAPMGAGGTMSMNQMFQPQPAAQVDVFSETTAITAPEGPKAPDPVEEELKAPLKAAAPVPGSIGSAVSMPPDANSPQNVAFNDPAAEASNLMNTNTAPAVKKNSILDKLMTKTKMDKKTLIMLIAVAGVIIVLLIVVLVMMMSGGI